MSAQEKWRLQEDEIQRLASRLFHPDSAVAVISILCNWGPPVSGRFDEDFLDVWAVTDDSLRPKSLVLYGCGVAGDSQPVSTRAWRDVGEFGKSKAVDVTGRPVGLYHYSSSLPVDQFVVRLTDSRDEYHYDNNGGYGIDYHLHRYHGLQLNCVRTARSVVGVDGQDDPMNWILVFPRLIELQGDLGIARVTLEH